MTELSTVTVSDVIARLPCGDWAARIPALVAPYRRERWSALEILSLAEVSEEDRLWVCLHDSLVHERVRVRFACEVAAGAMRLTGWTDPRSWGALEARLAYARGEIDAAARDAAWAAARSAARDAAWSAARDAAWSAARDAAGDAAGSAAWAAARDAAWSAAWAAARSAARDAAWSAAGSAAWSAAWSAARAAQITTLRTLLLLDLDGYDVLRGRLGGVVPRKVTDD